MNVLILEDDYDLATGMEISLRENDLYFTKCGTIREAREKLKKIGFDLLILDVNLPDGSGFDL